VQQHKPTAAQLAIGKWHGILSELGIDKKFLTNSHGPCPACAGRDRFRFDDKEGRGTWVCSHCGAGDGFKLLQLVLGWEFKHAAKEVERVAGVVRAETVRTERSEEDKVDFLKRVWAASRRVTHGDPVWTYLNGRTGVDLIPADIRYHPSLKHSSGGLYPAMLALMRDEAGRGTTIHRTYLQPDGKKAAVEGNKKFLPGRRLEGSAVRLGKAGETIGVAEGIETALSASRLFGMPVWCTNNAGLLESVALPKRFERVHIFGDNDASYTGQAAAYRLARRLTKEGMTVYVHIPESAGMDWNDVYQQGLK